MLLGVRFDSLQFKFPSVQKRMLGDHLFSHPTAIWMRDARVENSRNAVVNWCVDPYPNHVFLL